MFFTRKLIELVKMALEAPKSKLKIEGKLTVEVKISKGLREQRDVLSTTLFNLGARKCSKEVTDKSRDYHARAYSSMCRIR